MVARILYALIAMTAATSTADGRLQVVPAGDGIRVHVAKRGLFSAFAHDHDFEVTRWQGTAEIPDGDPRRASVELVLDADSLRDREKGLSDSDRREVEERTAGPEILDAAHHPEIAYRSDGMTLGAPSAAESGRLHGTLHGRLTVRGQTRPVDATLDAERVPEGWRANGSARFSQSDFGIRPFSGAGGTVGVKDEVEVTFSLALRAGAAAPPGVPPPARPDTP